MTINDKYMQIILYGIIYPLIFDKRKLRIKVKKIIICHLRLFTVQFEIVLIFKPDDLSFELKV